MHTLPCLAQYLYTCHSIAHCRPSLCPTLIEFGKGCFLEDTHHMKRKAKMFPCHDEYADMCHLHELVQATAMECVLQHALLTCSRKVELHLSHWEVALKQVVIHLQRARWKTCNTKQSCPFLSSSSCNLLECKTSTAACYAALLSFRFKSMLDFSMYMACEWLQCHSVRSLMLCR